MEGRTSSLATKKDSVSSKKAYLTGFNSNEASEECSTVSQTNNVSPSVLYDYYSTHHFYWVDL